jgi:hypothetical protein
VSDTFDAMPGSTADALLAAIRELERENAALKVQVRELIATMEEEGEMDAVRIKELKKENAALRADKDRLDSRRMRLMVHVKGNVWKTHEFVDVDLRAAIDAARKEAQP